MFAIALWIFILIVWIGILIVRTRPCMKKVSGNRSQILLAIVFIILAIINIVERTINLNSNASSESTPEIIETSSIEEQSYNEDKTYYIGESY